MATLLAVLVCFLSSGCSVRSWALNKAADALTSGSFATFSGDDDPELIAAALPFALKTYESLLESTPRHEGLLLATGSAFTMYAYAFVQLGGDTLPDSRLGEHALRSQRAKKLYMRARDYLLRALDLRHPGFSAALVRGKADSVLALTGRADTSLLYWTGAAWMGAYTTDKFDMSLAVEMPLAVALVRRCLALNDSFGGGSAHEFFVSYYGSLPSSMGGSEQRAREHFARALALARGTRAGPFVALASSVCVNKQDAAEFRQLLQKALAVNVDTDPSGRLANILNQRKAQWLLAHADSYFLEPATENQGERQQ
jgi:predicted anti-sigma-YlaC factor YlaD